MKKLFSLLLFCFAFIVVSCSDDDYTPAPPEVAIDNLSGKTTLIQGETLSFKANIKSALSSSFRWLLDDVQASTDSTYVFNANEVGNYTITLICENADGEKSVTVDVYVYGKYRDGVFVLNEGNMTSEAGSLIFINPQGEITDNAYFKINDITLGNVAQDLFIGNGKMYIVAQNNRKLVITNAETLKEEASYNDELSSLSWPTHVAAIGEDVFLRDNKGVHLFNSSTKTATLIEGSKGALKNRMAVTNNKVFAPASKSILVLEPGKSEVAHKIELDAPVSGVIKASDGNLWVSTTGTPQKIMKINSKDYSIMQTNEMPAEAKLGSGAGATPGISAKGDTIYFSNSSTKIYRHIFSKNTTDFMVDAKTMVEDATMVYNNLGVHPVTGEVYVTTIKGYGLNYLINNISVFNFEGATPILSANYKDYTRFPAGVFFTDYFRE